MQYLKPENPWSFECNIYDIVSNVNQHASIKMSNELFMWWFVSISRVVFLHKKIPQRGFLSHSNASKELDIT